MIVDLEDLLTLLKLPQMYSNNELMLVNSINALVQHYSDSVANALEILQSCTSTFNLVL